MATHSPTFCGCTVKTIIDTGPMPSITLSTLAVIDAWRDHPLDASLNIIGVGENLLPGDPCICPVHIDCSNGISVQTSAVFTCRLDCFDDRIVLCPVLLFNALPLRSAWPQSVVVSFDLEQHSPLPAGEPDVPVSANVASVALVSSPDYPSEYDYTDSLTEYFTREKIVQMNDVFPIPLSQYDSTMIEQSYSLLNYRLNFVYFKLIGASTTSEKSAAFLKIAVSKTTLYQKGVCNDKIGYFDTIFEAVFGSSINRLIEKVLPSLSFALCTDRPRLPFVLFRGKQGSGRTYMARALAKRLGFHLRLINCYELCAQTAAAVEEKLKNSLSTVGKFVPVIVMLKNLNSLMIKDNVTGRVNDRIVNTVEEILENLLCGEKKALILTASSSEDLHYSLSRLISHNVQVDHLTVDERISVIDSVLQREYKGAQHSISDEDVELLAKNSVNYVVGDLLALTRRVIHQVSTEKASDKYRAINCAFQQIFKEQELKFGAQNIQKVQWADIGGLDDIIEDLVETIRLSVVTREQSESSGCSQTLRSGILLYGPPGTGKTLLAKAVATECSLNFIGVKGPELVNMYVGQSEANVRDLFARLRAAAPCVLFCDELDSLTPRRGFSGDSGGVMDRLVAQFATEIDCLAEELSGGGGVVLIGATNRPDLIDPALLRVGRFDRMFYIGGNSGKEAQLRILLCLTRKFPLEESVFPQQIVSLLPQRMTGADVYAVCTAALQRAFRRTIFDIEADTDSQSSMGTGDVAFKVTFEDFKEATSLVQLSVTEEDFVKYDQMKLHFAI